MRFSPEQRILFPWERSKALPRWLRLGRVRPFLLVGLVLVLLPVIGLRERRRAGVRQTRAVLQDTRRALDAYQADHDGGCPPNLQGAMQYTGLERPAVDAWGQPLRLICPGRQKGSPYELMSDGPDGKPGGLDRIE